MKILIFSLCLISFATICQGQSTPELQQNPYAEYQKSDKAMNAAYQKLLGVLTDAGKKKLRLSQRAWVMFRDAEAGFDSHHFGDGKFGNIERLGSMNRQTQMRTKKLTEDHKRFKEINS